jgi:hypothetical protein
MNSATVNLGTQTAFAILISEFRSGIAGSYGNSMLSVLRKLNAAFYKDYNNLHSYQQRTRVLFSPYPHQHLSFVFS